MLYLRPSLLLLGLFPALVVAFDPTTYTRSSATCKATKRDTSQEVDISLSASTNLSCTSDAGGDLVSRLY